MKRQGGWDRLLQEPDKRWVAIFKEKHSTEYFVILNEEMPRSNESLQKENSMITSSPECLQEQAKLALQDGHWTPEQFKEFAKNVNNVANKLPNLHRLILDLYPDGNHGSGIFEIWLPNAQNESAILTLKTDATVLDKSAISLGGEVRFTLDQEGLRALAVFCNKALFKMEELPLAAQRPK